MMHVYLVFTEQLIFVLRKRRRLEHDLSRAQFASEVSLGRERETRGGAD